MQRKNHRNIVNFTLDVNSILEYVQNFLLTLFHVCRVEAIRISIHNDPPWGTFFMVIKSHYRNIGYGVWISMQHFIDLIGQLSSMDYKSVGRKLGNAWSRRIQHYNDNMHCRWCLEVYKPKESIDFLLT